MCDGKIKLSNFVNLSDIHAMCDILSMLGVKTWKEDNFLFVDTKGIKNEKITHELTKKVRVFIFLLGAILGRFRNAVIAYPGGCQIGERPIDIHLSGFRTLGVKVIERHGYIYCNGENMKPADIFCHFLVLVQQRV